VEDGKATDETRDPSPILEKERTSSFAFSSCAVLASNGVTLPDSSKGKSILPSRRFLGGR